MLLPEILQWWDDARNAFRQARVWARARRLGLSQLACLERHTMTGLRCSCGRQFVDWSADDRVFSKDRWEPNLLIRPVIRGSLNHLPESHPVIAPTPDGCDDFVTPEATDTKSPELILAPLPPLGYARSG